MQIFLRFFLIFIVLYHLFVTLFVYWIMKGQYYEFFSLSKDLLRLVFILTSVIVYFKNIKSYLKTWSRPIILFLVMVVFGVWVSYLQWKASYDIFIWLKYGFLYMFIFLSATWIWHNFAQKKDDNNIQKLTSFLKNFLSIWLIISIIRQLLKFIFPDIFQTIWYWPIGDYVFWQNPPLYYRTWPWWLPRFQWIFAWPNNYWYFLVAFFGIFVAILNGYKKTVKKSLNIIMIILRILSIVLTISRSAFIWLILVLILLNLNRIKKHAKISVLLSVVFIVIIWAVSILKWWSTLAHISSKFWSLIYVIKNPLWYGLWTSWPAVFHNWSILPENYYIQLLIDIWAIWLFFRLLFTKSVSNIFQKIIKSDIKKHERHLYSIRLSWIFWMIWLLIIGLFLHVFEDSMINYLFFIVFGIFTWYLYQLSILHKTNKSNKN